MIGSREPTRREERQRIATNKAQFRITLLYHITLPLDPAYYPFSNFLLTLSLYASTSLALTSFCGIAAPLVFNIKYKKATKKQVSWMLGLCASDTATLLLKYFRLDEDLEICFVILPCIAGLWFLEAGLWMCVEGYLDKKRARGGVRIGAGVRIGGGVRTGDGRGTWRELEAGKRMLE